MAIRTQQFEISGVCLPVAEATTPCVSSFRTDLRRRVFVVDVKRPNVRKSTYDALPAQGFDQRKFAPPIARMLVDRRSILVPIGFGTNRRTELRRAVFAALPALAGAAPSRGHVASATAVFARSVAQSVGVHRRLLTAVRTGDFIRLRPHANGIAKYYGHAKPKYFDIACRRIEDATRQRDLFVEPQPAPKQTVLFDEVGT